MRRRVPGWSTRARSDRDDGQPAPVTGADPDSAGYATLHRRLPRLVEQVRTANPHTPGHAAALDRLVAESAGEVEPPDTGAADAADWHRWTAPHVGRRWDEVPALFAESWFHRRLLDAVDFFTPGPWYRLDPFGHLKAAALADQRLAAELAELDWIADVDAPGRRAALLRATVRGQRADLGQVAHDARFGVATGAELVVDDSAALEECLAAGGHRLCLVAGDAGHALLADLLLVDELLGSGCAVEVVLHVAPTPFATAAVPADVAAALRRLDAAGGYVAGAARRLHEAFRTGVVRLRTSAFAVSPLGFDTLPDDLAADLAAATLTVLKGDLGYRRLVGDLQWPSATRLAEAAGAVPGPVALLRVMTSEVVVGVAAERVAELDRHRPGWRTDGTHAVVQLLG